MAAVLAACQNNQTPPPAGGATPPATRGSTQSAAPILAGGKGGDSLSGTSGIQVQLDNFDHSFSPGKLPPHWGKKKWAPLMFDGDMFFYHFFHDPATGDHYIHLKSGKNNSFSLGNDFTFLLDDYPVLSWEWKMAVLPVGGDIRVKEKDDQAGIMCVVVDPSLLNSKTLCYLWENKGPVGMEVDSTKRKDSKYIILRSADKDPLNSWAAEKRNIRADYIRLFGSLPKAKALISLQIDSDDTGSQSEAFYRNILLKGQ
ncbi:MAG: DUF3047 domain-containing protein [Deltaproteobacteria bacterium]|nr:DUF3047 domain-containing protein [Deltaproteobacteria bacterium]